MNENGIKYRHVDVFADRPFFGNGLTVFLGSLFLDSAIMQRVAQEMRQFESIFLSVPDSNNTVAARIFTVEEELDFAGHPLLGSAAVLHREYGTDSKETWNIRVPSGTIAVSSERIDSRAYRCQMRQPQPIFGPTIGRQFCGAIAESLSLSVSDLHQELPIQVVSTGLPYLIVPLKSGLSKARIAISQFEGLLSRFGAKFVYVYDVAASEGRTWDNAGLIEDVATGSAAGPTAAFLCRHSFLEPDMDLEIYQGSYVGRPSTITARVTGARTEMTGVDVSGCVVLVASGVLENW